MGKKILVIDDEEVIRKSFNLALEESGYDVLAVESGEKGLEEIKNQKYDMVFLDLKMKGIDGVATLRGIRQMDRKIPILIVTAFHKEFFTELQKASKDKLEFDLVEKPISGDKILNIARSVLENSVISD